MASNQLSVLTERFEAHVRDHPGSPAMDWIPESGTIGAPLTYAQIDRSATAIAHWLRAEMGVQPGGRVMLVYPPGLDFAVAFMGCLKAGIVAVPVYPPLPNRLAVDLKRFNHIARNSGARLALTNRFYLRAHRLLRGKAFLARTSWPRLRWKSTDHDWDRVDDDLSPPVPSDLAFLQYTSGSTGDPKAVMVTHGNLAHNLSLTARCLGTSRHSVFVSWLPQYHDMGLIGILLGMFWCGGRGYYMSPFQFVSNPLLWLEAVTDFGGTHLAAPNFAFELCVRDWHEEADPPALDLSTIEMLLNGADVIRPRTIERFTATFGPVGFRPETLFPSYGLAEHTVFVAAHQGAPMFSKGWAALGKPEPEVAVRIVDPVHLTEVTEGDEGEIWVDSPSKALGYMGMPAKSAETFYARLPDDPEGRQYLRTGDLGFLSGGEMHVTGRLKDLIQMDDGRTLYASEIEDAAEQSDSDIRQGCSAAFQTQQGNKQQLVLVAEVHDVSPWEAHMIEQHVASAVSEKFDVALDVIAFLPPHSVPKTTSGKVQRNRTRGMWLDKEIHPSYVGHPHLRDVTPAPSMGEPAQEAPALRVRGIEKSYGDNTVLREVDLDIGRGEIHALVGRNGAGKTTTVSIISRLLAPDAGTVRLFGLDLSANRAEYKRHLGLAGQDIGVYLSLTARQNLQFFGELAEMKSEAVRKRIDQLAESLLLGSFLDTPARHLSGGQKRRVHTAIAMMHRPPLLILDEPTAGVDVQTRASLVEAVRQVARDGGAVLYTTHYLPEVEAMEATVSILEAGSIIAGGSIPDLIEAHSQSELHLRFDGGPPNTDPLERHGLTPRIEGDVLIVDTPVTDVAHVLAALGPDVSRMAGLDLVEPSLETVFVNLTGHSGASQTSDGGEQL